MLRACHLKLAPGRGLAAWLGRALLLGATAPAEAMAESRVAVHAPASFVAGDPSVVAESPGARGDRVLRAMVVVDYVRAPLMLVARDQSAHEVVAEQVWLHVAAALSLQHRWLLALDVPVLLRERGETRPFVAGVPPASERVALGDPRVSLRARVLGDAEGLALGLGARASIPLATEAYAGSPGPVLGPFVALGHQNSASFSAFDLGFAWREAQTLPGVLPTRLGSAVTVALAGGVTLDGSRATRLGPELAFSTTVSNGARLLDARSSACELLLHLRHRAWGGPFELGLAFGPSVGRAPGAADYRALLSLVFSPEEPAPPPDRDGDRVPDDTDLCPSLRGEPSDDPMMHGCPPVPSDADGDGVPDTLDACPLTPGESSLVRKRHGCPAPQDHDGDTIEDPEEACPNALGQESPDAKQRGCPKLAVRLEQTQITISEQIQFETGTALIRDESSALLQQVADVLEGHPEIEGCEIAGHTDDTGETELNRQLSEARARAVRDWLVARGVRRERLSARGHGETRPIADNSSEQGRARNRRVEFLITRQAGSSPTEGP